MAPRKHQQITHLVVHHSASPRLTTFAEIVGWHTAPKPHGNGWDGIGYHYVILEDGSLRVGRPFLEVGAHAPPNSGRIGVCVTGNNLRPEDHWSTLQILSLIELIRAFRVLFPGAWVVGHRDVSKPGHTECPGIDVSDLL